MLTIDGNRVQKADVVLKLNSGELFIVLKHRDDCAGPIFCDCDPELIRIGRFPCADWDYGENPNKILCEEDQDAMVELRSLWDGYISDSGDEHPSLTLSERNF